MSSEDLVQMGMRAVVRDLVEYVQVNAGADNTVDADNLQAYLLACMITAGGYEDLSDGES